MRLNAGYDLLYLASDADLGAQKLFGLLHGLAGNDFTHLELQLREIVKGNLCLRLDVDDVCSLLFCLFRLILLCRVRSLLSLNLLQNLFHVQSREQNLRLVGYLIAGLIETEHVHNLQGTLSRAQLCQNLVGSLRHERL